MQVMNILFQRSAAMRCQAGVVRDCALHTFQRSGAGNREFMKVDLELAVAVKAQASHDSQNRRRVSFEALRQIPNAQQNVFFGILLNGTNELLALEMELAYALSKARIVAKPVRCACSHGNS